MEQKHILSLFEFIDEGFTSSSKYHHLSCDTCGATLTSTFFMHRRKDIDFCSNKCIDEFSGEVHQCDLEIVNLNDLRLRFINTINFYHSAPENYSMPNVLAISKKTPEFMIKLTKKFYRYSFYLQNINTPSNKSRDILSNKEMFISYISMADWVAIRDAYAGMILVNINMTSRYYGKFALFIIDYAGNTGMEIIDADAEMLKQYEDEWLRITGNSKIDYVEWLALHRLKVRYIFN